MQKRKSAVQINNVRLITPLKAGVVQVSGPSGKYNWSLNQCMECAYTDAKYRRVLRLGP